MASNFVDISYVRTKRNKKINHSIENKNKQIDYILNGKIVEYDFKTTNYYKTLRQCHLDPILNINVDENIAFKFKYQWDAYTGERLCEDPFGALYFHPITLIYYFYNHRLDGLWKNNIDSTAGYFQGYYDMLVGSGDELEIVGRGKMTELYLFRLPIPDCYLTNEHNKSIITMGPKLTNDEINELDKLSQNENVKQLFHEYFNFDCPSIKKIKMLYDNSISKNPDVSSIANIDEINKKYIVIQHYFVDMLKNF